VNSSRFSTLPHAAMCLSWAILLLQAFLATMVRKHRLERHYPAFSLYLYVSAVRSAVMFWIASYSSATVYLRAYYISAAIFSVLVAACAAEIYMKVFGPRMALPVWAFRNVFTLLPAAMVSSVIVAALFGSLKGPLAARVMWTMQQAIFAAAWAVLVAMRAYSKRLRIGWPTRVAGIAQGFVLMLSVNMVAAVVIGRAGRTAAITAAFVGQSANIAALAWWVWRFWEKEPEPVQATPEQVQTMLEWLKPTLEAMRHSSTQGDDQKVIQL
jgi:hypothetical protein